MTELDRSRRRFLKMFAGGAAVSIGAGLGIWSSGGTSAEDPSASPTPPPTSTSAPTLQPTQTPTSTPEPTPTPPPKTVDIRDFGAAVDGETDDTRAILNAISTVRVSGTVVVPPGDVRVSARENGYDHTESKAAIPMERPDDGLTLRGGGPDKTRLFMGPDHERNHKGIGVLDEYSGTAGSEHSGLTVRDLTFDGNWEAQSESDGRVPNGFGVDIRGTERNITFENCVFENWATNGGLMAAPGIRIRNCSFKHNGYGIAEMGSSGHGFNVRTTSGPGRVVAENCYFFDNTGNGVDIRGGKATIRNSVFKRHGFGVKIKPKVEEAVLENCQLLDSEHMHIHCVPSGDEGTGLLRLRSVVMKNSKWPAITLNQRPGVLKGTDILIKDADTEDNKQGAVFIDSHSPLGDREVDIDRLSIHGTTGAAIDFSNAYGRIGELIHTETDGVGDSAEVDVDEAEIDDPISVSVPSISDVGATE